MSVSRSRDALRYPALAVAAVVGLVAVKLSVNRFVVPRVIGSEAFRLPGLEMASETITALVLVPNLFGLLVLPVIVFWLGTRYGRATA